MIQQTKPILRRHTTREVLQHQIKHVLMMKECVNANSEEGQTILY